MVWSYGTQPSRGELRQQSSPVTPTPPTMKPVFNNNTGEISRQLQSQTKLESKLASTLSMNSSKREPPTIQRQMVYSSTTDDLPTVSATIATAVRNSKVHSPEQISPKIQHQQRDSIASIVSQNRILSESEGEQYLKQVPEHYGKLFELRIPINAILNHWLGNSKQV